MAAGRVGASVRGVGRRRNVELLAQERVHAAAVRLFATKGFHGTGIRDLAESAGLSSASLYHYMGTKEDLLLHIMRDCLQKLFKTGQQIVADGDSPVRGLGRLIQLHVLTHALMQDETIVVDNEIRSLSTRSRRKVLVLRDDYEELWRGVIHAGCESGQFSVPDASIARLGLLELCTGVARWYSIDGPLSLSEVTQAHVEMAYAMVGVKAQRGRTLGDLVPPLADTLTHVTETWGLQVP